MAFRLLDLGIPNFDTNVNVLYRHAVEHGKSHLLPGEEYVVDRIGKSDAVVILHYLYEDDGETPRAVEAHTFIESDCRWQDASVRAEGRACSLEPGSELLPVELINGGAAGSGVLIPILYADEVTFALHAADLGISEQDAACGRLLAAGEDVCLTAQVADIRPQIVSGIWLYSTVRLCLAEGRGIVMPVCRDTMDDQLAQSEAGGWVRVRGKLSARYLWPGEA